MLCRGFLGRGPPRLSAARTYVFVAHLSAAACRRDGALAIGALQRPIERDNLLIRDLLDDRHGLGLGASPAVPLRSGFSCLTTVRDSNTAAAYEDDDPQTVLSLWPS